MRGRLDDHQVTQTEDMLTSLRLTENVRESNRDSDYSGQQSKDDGGEFAMLIAQKDVELRTLKQRLHQAEQKCEILEKGNHTLHQDVHLQEQEIYVLGGKVAKRNETIQKYKDALYHREVQLEQYQRDLGKSQRDAENLAIELVSVQRQLDKSNELLNQRAYELRMVDSYMSRTNAHSDIELKEMVEMLNHEISQTSSTIMDALDFNIPCRKVIPASKRKEAFQKLGDILPPAFLDCLADHRSPSNDIGEDIGVSVAIQAIMAECVFEYVQSWCPANRNFSKFLEDIYQGLRSS
ncbi:hypothetical protein AX16_004880, partial [Volvariella volvacea WC 439]